LQYLKNKELFMPHISPSAFGGIILSSQVQNQASWVRSKQEIPGCWNKVKNVALNFLNTTSDSTSPPDNSLGILAVVLLYGVCIAIFIFQIIIALRR
jgi:hypothetical protein